MKDEDNITPITGITAPPLPPIAPFFAWTWTSPVIPEFYWNVYSAEQRIKQICLEIGKIEAYLQYFCFKANEAHADLHKKIDEANKRIDELTEQFNTEVANLNNLIAQETANRIDADNQLQSNIDAEAQTRAEADNRLQANIDAEAGIRADADNTLQTNIDNEAKARQDADNSLHEEISAETTARIHADDVLHGEISAEATARTDADAQLQTNITTETEQRKQQDAVLSNKIETEVNDRTDADATLLNKIYMVDNRVTEVATDLTEEVDARQAADTILQNDINTRLTPGDIVAANRITVTRGPDNKVTVGDTFDADFDAVENSIEGIRSALDEEVSERRNDDQNLQTQINNRIELGKVLGTAPITVTNDPDATTATVSVDAATASSAGVMSLETVRNQSRAGNGLKADVTGSDRYVSVNPKPGEGIAATAEGVSVQLNPNGGLYHTETGVAANLNAISSAVSGRIAGKGLKENTETHKLDVQAGDGIVIDDENKVAVKAGKGLAVYDGMLGISFSQENPNDVTPVGKTGFATDSNYGVRLAIKPYNMTPLYLDSNGYVGIYGSKSISTYGAGGGQISVNPNGLYEEYYSIDDEYVRFELGGATTLPSNRYIPLNVTMDCGANPPIMTRFVLMMAGSSGDETDRLDYRVEDVSYNYQDIRVRFGIRFVGDSTTTDYPLSGTTFKLIPYRMVARGPEQG